MAKQMNGQELGTEDAAVYVKLSLVHFRRYINQEDGVKPTRQVGRVFLFSLEELDRFKATLPRKTGPKKKD